MNKTLFTNKSVGEKIQILEWLDEKHEADLIANTIRESEEDYKDFCVLYRTNGQSRLIEESLIRKNIAYRVYGGMKFYERKEIKDILAYIRVIFNPLDTISLRRIINVPSRKIGDKSFEQLEKLLEREHLSLAELAENEFLLNALSGVGVKGIMSFLLIYRELREVAKEKSVHELMEIIIKKIQYEAYLKEEYDENEYESKLENLEEFVSMASRYDGLIFPENLALFLEDIALITDQDRDNESNNVSWPEKGSVSLMTVHLAKWLEFPTVFIAWAEEGIFPHSRSLLENMALEEERRLMYVAITRAKEKLYISRAFERYSFGNYSSNPKSRFIKEIPEDLMIAPVREDMAKSIFGNASGGGFSSFGNLFWGNGGISKNAEISGRTAQGAKKNNAADFQTGDRIKHPQYGNGTIISINEAIAEIAFSGMGIKKMNIEIAPIQKL